MRSADPFLARQIAERAVRAAWALEVKSEERRRSVVSWPLAAVREAWFRGKPYIQHMKSPSSRGFYTKKAKNINARRMEHEDTMKLKKRPHRRQSMVSVICQVCPLLSPFETRLSFPRCRSRWDFGFSTEPSEHEASSAPRASLQTLRPAARRPA